MAIVNESALLLIVVAACVTGGCGARTYNLGGDVADASGLPTFDSGSAFAPAVDSGAIPAATEIADGGPFTSAEIVAGVRFAPLAVYHARTICSSRWPSTPPAAASISRSRTTAALTGAWFMCTYTDSRSAGSYLFTSDGFWCAMAIDDLGYLGCTSDPGEAGAPPYSGSYSFDDANGQPLVGDGAVGWVATAGSLWFQPVFASDGNYLWMQWINGATVGLARVQ